MRLHAVKIASFTIFNCLWVVPVIVHIRKYLVQILHRHAAKGLARQCIFISSSSCLWKPNFDKGIITHHKGSGIKGTDHVVVRVRVCSGRSSTLSSSS